jgi:hypothetical protein
LIPTTSDSRIRWCRFDWLVTQHRTDSPQENLLRKDAQRGHSNALDHRKTRPNSNQRKESSLNNKPKFERVTRPDHTCKEEVGLIADYLSGRLDPTILAAFEKHLNDCPDCTAFLNTYKKTIEATKAFLRTHPVKIWPASLKLRPQDRRSLVTLIAGCIFSCLTCI